MRLTRPVACESCMRHVVGLHAASLPSSNGVQCTAAQNVCSDVELNSWFEFWQHTHRIRRLPPLSPETPRRHTVVWTHAGPSDLTPIIVTPSWTSVTIRMSAHSRHRCHEAGPIGGPVDQNTGASADRPTSEQNFKPKGSNHKKSRWQNLTWRLWLKNETHTFT